MLLRRLGYKVPPPRSWSSIGVMSAMDGNILGGLLLGAGMQISSSCPGMAFVQLAMGVPSAPAIIAGGAVGGMLWVSALRPWIEEGRKRRSSSFSSSSSQQQQQPPPAKTIAAAAGMSHTTTFLLYEAGLAGVVAITAMRMSTAPSPVHPVLGGLVIGGAQLVSLLLRGSLLGVSTCYEQLGEWIVYLAAPPSSESSRPRPRRPRPGTSALLFSAAMVAGAYLLVQVRPELATRYVITPPGQTTSLVEAVAGGFLMAVGARMGGGCTSGHGISGMALLSMSSVVTMVAAFAAAIGVASLKKI